MLGQCRWTKEYYEMLERIVNSHLHKIARTQFPEIVTKRRVRLPLQSNIIDLMDKLPFRAFLRGRHLKAVIHVADLPCGYV